MSPRRKVDEIIDSLPLIASNGLPAHYVPFEAVAHLFEQDYMLRVGGTPGVWTDNGLHTPDSASLAHVAEAVTTEAEKSLRLHNHAKTCPGGTEGRPCMVCGKVTD